jgi:hypothetical protein
MDFSNRAIKPQGTAPAPAASNNDSGNSGRSSKVDKSKLQRIGVVAAVAAIVVLLGASILALATSKGESQHIKKNELQAVFLNTGQVYFGNIKDLNSKYLTLTNIYYLQTANGGSDAQQQSNSNVTLVKLGCELHEPFDLMVINRDQVTFWENLQDGGQVATAVANFVKQNPDGQKCADQSSSASTNSVNNTQNANNGSTGTTNSTPATGTTPNTNSTNTTR